MTNQGRRSPPGEGRVWMMKGQGCQLRLRLSGAVSARSRDLIKAVESLLLETCGPDFRPEPAAALGHSISRNILERLFRVAGPLARHLQHAFADDVALDLVGTAGD